jgi:hypothetical protein
MAVRTNGIAVRTEHVQEVQTDQARQAATRMGVVGGFGKMDHQSLVNLAAGLYGLTQHAECPDWVQGAGYELTRDFGAK